MIDLQRMLVLASISSLLFSSPATGQEELTCETAFDGNSTTSVTLSGDLECDVPTTLVVEEDAAVTIDVSEASTLGNLRFMVLGGASLVFENEGSEVEMENSFSGFREPGGAISNFGSVVFKGDAAFRGNTAGTFGGAIHIFAGGEVVFEGKTAFEENFSEADQNGGAVYCEGSITFMDDAVFIDNVAPGLGSGGAVYNFGEGQVTFESNTNFVDNVAPRAGGAVFTQGQNASVSFGGDATFIGNQAAQTDVDLEEDGNGGALYMDNGVVSFAAAATFHNNTAGGGFAASDGSVVTFDGEASFSGNEATARGGGFSVGNTSEATFGADVAFDYNRAGPEYFEDDGSTLTFEGEVETAPTPVPTPGPTSESSPRCTEDTSGGGRRAADCVDDGDEVDANTTDGGIKSAALPSLTVVVSSVLVCLWTFSASSAAGCV